MDESDTNRSVTLLLPLWQRAALKSQGEKLQHFSEKSVTAEDGVSQIHAPGSSEVYCGQQTQALTALPAGSQSPHQQEECATSKCKLWLGDPAVGQHGPVTSPGA